MPEGWAWCRFSEASINRDSERKPVNSSNRKNVKKIYDYYGAAGVIDKVEEYLFDEKLLLIGEDGANLLSRTKNNAFIACGKYWVNNHAHVIDCFDKSMLDYLCYYINAITLDEYITGSAQPKFTQKALNDLLLPLPALKEQQRIINTIERFFAKIDELELNKTDIQTAIKQAKSKILDLAIHGKLVPQDPNDEPAEELLKRIATSDNRPYKKFDDEEPFDIPESWSWCTLGEIYTHTTGKALKKTNNKGTLRKYITTSNLYWNSFDFTEVREMYFTDDELEKCTIKKGDLILCNGGDVGRAAIWNYDYDICYQNHVSRLRPKNENINNSFFLYLIMIYKQQGMLNGKGVGITSLSASDLLSAVIPLPPYQEQRRIVTKIEELFKNLDEILQNLLA